MEKKEDFKIDVDKLKALNISVLKATYKEGEKHLRYFYGTMSVFKHPELRLKAHDTVYYEKVVPIIAEILGAKNQTI